MLIGLGFAVALLLALVVGRFAWNTALGFSKRRKNQQIPAAVLQLQTERDGLRAEYAMLSRRLELRLDDLKARLVEQMAEVSRNRNRIHKMMEDLDRQSSLVAERDKEIEKLKAQGISLEDDILARTGNLQAANERITAQDAELAALRQAVAERDGELQDLRADLAGLPPPTEDMAGLPAEERLRRRIANLSALSGEIASQREIIQRERAVFASPEPMPQSAAKLAAKIEAAERDADGLSEELRKLDENWTAQLKRAVAAEAKEAAAETPAEDPQRGLANVISLAQRIRSLKQDLG